MGNSIVVSVASVIAPMLEQFGFSRNAEGFFRVRQQFADYLSIQVRSDNAAVALNAGVQPLYLLTSEKRVTDALRGASEIDCYVRVRLTPEGQTDNWLSMALGTTRLASEIELIFKECGLPFFEFFASVQSLCEILTIDAIESGKLSKCFSMLTKSRLALLGARTHVVCGNHSLAKAFAVYGLSVVGMAVNLKREFKNIIIAAEHPEEQTPKASDTDTSQKKME
jgi:hypothetical protein